MNFFALYAVLNKNLAALNRKYFVLTLLLSLVGCGEVTESNELATHQITPSIFFDTNSGVGFVTAALVDTQGRPINLSEGDALFAYSGGFKYQLGGGGYLGYTSSMMLATPIGAEIRVALERSAADKVSAEYSYVTAQPPLVITAPSGTYARTANVALSWQPRAGREFSVHQEWSCKGLSDTNYQYAFDNDATTVDDGQHIFAIASILASMQHSNQKGCVVNLKVIATTAGEIDANFNGGEISTYQYKEYSFYVEAI